ncbi:hypothetical protein CSUB_C0397 [Candidatus Caldarchaeum subterraneum]|uniref:DNA primase/polymerase bifunctional N-terminal domain-containing protein n=1 Tax=Caldiarchaeum subterraneum TaxID=311458 RepID=E6N543_CALS0|nr:hypothetical protein HGMM_F29F08C21 [Candidatus Caldarchaeum subterraneum]BAJ50258.1 hypothetical protein CSUB_C0397 [Candidatus Caldarchaeum subterraneum]
MGETTNLRADDYFSRGLVVIPLVRGDKRPMVSEWQKKSREELFAVFREHSGCNIGIRLDSLTVLDIEHARLWRLFFETEPRELASKTWVSRTGGGGYHVYFKGSTTPSKADGYAELRSGEKQFVVAPPQHTPPEIGISG